MRKLFSLNLQWFALPLLCAIFVFGTAYRIPAQGKPSDARSDQLKSVRVNGVELHYVERGRGTPVIFVHGGLDDYRTWSAQMGPFSEQYRAIAYSRRYNFPNNNPTTSANHSAIIEAEDLAALIKSLKLERVHVVGASYGAYTALCLALRHPEMVRTLVLAEAPVLRLAQSSERGTSLFEEFMANMWRPAGDAFRKNDKEGALRLTIEYFIGKGSYVQIPQNLLQDWRANLPEWQALTTSSDALPNLSHKDLTSIKAPVLMLSGERTLNIHKFVDAELEPLLRAERVVIPAATHDMWSEQPEACRKATLAFLAKR